MKKIIVLLLGAVLIAALPGTSSCHKPEPMDPDGTDTLPPPVQPPFNIDGLTDTYGHVASVDQVSQWGPYNVHDPAIIRDGQYFYSYSTDVCFGGKIRPGIQIRRSKDLVDWQFYGWVFNGLPAQGTQYIQQQGGTPFNGLWAPYVVKVGSEFRLYYSLSSPQPTPRLSVIGLATAPTPVGPWTEKGLVVSSTHDNSVQTNAIDPSVLIDPQGKHWLYFGSAWDGIHVLELNPANGLPFSFGDRGQRVAQRGYTGGTPNGNIEGAEIIYNPQFQKYYLFIAYDWLQTKYNVRVGRSDSPNGPFYDFTGKDLNIEEDDGPMILAPYRFAGHGGWQGTAHCAVFQDNGQFYMAHQGRPGVNSYYMVMHVRKMFWTEGGWPVVSPERYAATEQTPVATSELEGDWERIELGYQVVPGYQNEQLSPDFQVFTPMTLDAAGTIDGNPNRHWTYVSPWLLITWENGNSDKLYIERGRDWENKRSCIVATGLNNDGTAVWGKK